MRLPSATIRTLLCVGADIVRPPLPGTRQKTVDAAKIRRAHNVRPYKSPPQNGEVLDNLPVSAYNKGHDQNPGREGRIP